MAIRALEHVGRRPALPQPPRGGSRLVPRRYPDPPKPVGRLRRQSCFCSLSWNHAPPLPPAPMRRRLGGPHRAYSRLAEAVASHCFRRGHWFTAGPTLRNQHASPCESAFPCRPTQGRMALGSFRVSGSRRLLWGLQHFQEEARVQGSTQHTRNRSSEFCNDFHLSVFSDHSTIIL